VTFTATVSPSAATGTVTFKDGTTTLGTGTLSSGKATYSTSTLAVGSHSITASYGGDTNDSTSTSSVLTQTVKSNTTTTVASSLNPSAYGTAVTFTATVTPSTATGTVTFKNGSSTLGTGTLSNGTASYTTSTLTAGTHSITAAYGGDSFDNTSTSSALTQTVNKTATTTTVSSSANPSGSGSSVTFTATVTPSIATGTVTFKNGSSTLGTGTLSNGTASLSTSSLSVGSHSITASYGGDSNDSSSTSSALTQVVEQGSSTTLSSSVNPAPYGGVVTFTATVSPSAATGSVTFYDSGTSLGSASLSSGLASFATSSLAAGSHSITAIYSGNSTYAGSTSASLNETIKTITSVALAPQTATIAAGASQQFTLTATYSDNSQGNVSSSANWTSSDDTVVTVNANGIAIGAGQGTATIQATIGSLNGSATVTGTPSKFRLVGNVVTPADTRTATLLQNGEVLLAGGYVGAGKITANSELYNPVTGNFTATGPLFYARFGHTATLLPNGKVLIVGGTSPNSDGTTYAQAVAELYDPSSGSFTQTGSLNTPRSGHTATLLQNGQVLIAGGGYATSELYDPSTGVFTNSGSLNTVRGDNTATLLNDGTVLIAGGDGFVNSQDTVFATAELYNPASGTFTYTGNLNTPRAFHTATLLGNGKVLIATGVDQNYSDTIDAELYDPVAKAFATTANLTYERAYAAATGLNTGQALIVGGGDNNGNYIAQAELYDPTSGTFSIAGNLNIPRTTETATLLSDGTVLIAQGDGPDAFIPQAEIYQTSGQPEPPDTLQITPTTANVVVGGTQKFNAIDNNGNPRTDVTWTVSDPSLASVTTDENDSAEIKGLAAGQVTLTATAEAVSAQEQVNIVSASVYIPGTTIWSLPAVPGFAVQQVVQAVPTSGGPDLYTAQLSSDGTQSVLQALTVDGTQLWQTTTGPLNSNAVPDGLGGVIVTEYDTCFGTQTNPLSVVDLDPTYGQPVWQVSAAGVYQGNGIRYCYGASGDAPQIAVRGDGAAIISEQTNNGFPPLTLVLSTGQAYSYYIPPSEATVHGVTTPFQCCMSAPMVNVDGTAYVEYEVRYFTDTGVTSDTLYLSQINQDNSSSDTVLSSTTEDQALLPGSIVPDGQGGIIATWTISPVGSPVPQYPYQAVDVANGTVGTPYNLPFSPNSVAPNDSPTIVLGENGTAFASGHTTASDGSTQIDQLVSFSISSGAPNWTYQGTQGNHLSVIEATSGNGLSGKNTDSNGNDTVLNLNPDGSIFDQLFGGLSNVDYYSNGSWLGVSNGSLTAVLGDAIQAANSSSPHQLGNGLKQRSYVPVLWNFEAFDPSPASGLLAVDFPDRYNATQTVNTITGKQQTLGQVTRGEFMIYSGASWKNFSGELLKPLDGVAFIGHSLTGTTAGGYPARAVGLCFFNYACVQRPFVPGDPEFGTESMSPVTPITSVDVEPYLQTQARLIFISACNMDANMQEWLGVTSSSRGRALVVPNSNVDVDMYMGEFAWERILSHLNDVPGVTTLATAVNSANIDINNQHWTDDNGNPIPAVNWTVIGDGTVHY